MRRRRRRPSISPSEPPASIPLKRAVMSLMMMLLASPASASSVVRRSVLSSVGAAAFVRPGLALPLAERRASFSSSFSSSRSSLSRPSDAPHARRRTSTFSVPSAPTTAAPTRRRPSSSSRNFVGRVGPLSSESSTSSDDASSGPDESPDFESAYASDAPYTLTLSVPTPEDMEDVGAVLSVGTSGGDVILLGGDLGAGKTCLSRGFVRARTGMEGMRVTSPTYLLSNSYPADGGRTTIYHMDLYRLKGGEDLEPLDMAKTLTDGICLIEWPSRLGESLPPARLDITFRIHDEDIDGEDKEEEEDDDDDEATARRLTLRAHGPRWEGRLKALEEDGCLDDLLI